MTAATAPGQRGWGPGGQSRAEIEQQIEANEQETAEAHAAYLAGQAALRR